MLFRVTTIVEGITGLALLAVPSFFVSIVLGTTLSEPGGVLMGRLAGIALLSLSVICWSYRKEIQGISRITKALLLYNVAAASLLIYASVTGFSGIGLWPAMLLHIGLGIWCAQSLQKKS
jgi:hypothetical protein